MTIPSQESQRRQYLQAVAAEREKKKEEAKQQAEESWEQYQAPKEKPNIKEILWNGWQSVEKQQKRLSELYNRMYSIYKNRPDLLNNVSGLYRTVWYDTMSKQEKQIVDYFLWGRPKYNVTDDSLNL